MRIHLTNLPHTAPTRAFDWCAYTAKVRRWATMLSGLGHDVTIYGGVPAADCQLKYVACTSDEAAALWWPDWDSSQVWPGWDADAPWWTATNAAIAEHIENGFEEGDVIAITAGRAQRAISDRLGWRFGAQNMTVIEWAVGYEGVFTDRRVFESHAWRHHIYGTLKMARGNLYDTVIPNFYLDDEFTDGTGRGMVDGEEYLLFLGRRIEAKGCEIVEEIAKRFPVVVAGQGDYPIPSAMADVGVILGEEKRALLSGARGVIVPTLYIEPFGGVAVEAMLQGTPVITTDFGAFTETVLDGYSGHRCSSLTDFLWAVEYGVNELDRSDVAEWARARYTAKAVAPAWERWLDYVTDYTAGRDWYTTGEGIK